jgi:hypothetical protein
LCSLGWLAHLSQAQSWQRQRYRPLIGEATGAFLFGSEAKA